MFLVVRNGDGDFLFSVNRLKFVHCQLIIKQLNKYLKKTVVLKFQKIREVFKNKFRILLRSFYIIRQSVFVIFIVKKK